MKTKLGLLIFSTGDAIELSQVAAITVCDGNSETDAEVNIVLHSSKELTWTYLSTRAARNAGRRITKLWMEYRAGLPTPWKTVAQDLYDNLKAHHAHQQQECKVMFVGDEQKLEVDLGEVYSDASLYGDTCLALHGYEQLLPPAPPAGA